jgi:putative membrane protein
MNKLRAFCLIAGLTVASVAAAASNPASQEFANSAAGAGMAEVALGKMAQQKAQSTGVKAFAETMVTEHGKTNDELKRLANENGIALPSAIPDDQKAAAEMLGGYSGAVFDQAYMAKMVEDHEEAVSLFDNAATNTEIPASLRDFAKKTLPTLRHHLEQARTLMTGLGPPLKQSSR